MMLWLYFSVFCDLLPELTRLPSDFLLRKMVKPSIELWLLAIATLIVVIY